MSILRVARLTLVSAVLVACGESSHETPVGAGDAGGTEASLGNEAASPADGAATEAASNDATGRGWLTDRRSGALALRERRRRSRARWLGLPRCHPFSMELRQW